MYDKIGDAAVALWKFTIALLVLLIVVLPLATWKIIEIAIWFFEHIRWES